MIIFIAEKRIRIITTTTQLIWTAEEYKWQCLFGRTFPREGPVLSHSETNTYICWIARPLPHINDRKRVVLQTFTYFARIQRLIMDNKTMPGMEYFNVPLKSQLLNNNQFIIMYHPPQPRCNWIFNWKQITITSSLLIWVSRRDCHYELASQPGKRYIDDIPTNRSTWTNFTTFFPPPRH